MGIILAAKAVETDANKPAWCDEAQKWADASATAFFGSTSSMTSTTVATRPTTVHLKLGACCGGWEENGTNPSYHSPGSYKVMRYYQRDFADSDRCGYSAIPPDEWNKLIHTSQEVLLAVQCSGSMDTWWTRQEVCWQSLSPTSIMPVAGRFWVI